ncbi:MAG: putative secreted hydrolase [Planctomycetota bacterium]
MRRIAQLIILSIIVLVVLVLVTRNEEKINSSGAEAFSIAEVLRGKDEENFARVMQAREFHFPKDYGAHNDYRTEWWYFTGNLEDTSGRPFGYQLTFFRFSPTTKIEGSQSSWRSNQFYMAHFALTDINEKRFYNFERFSRAGAGLAGAKPGGLHVWLDDWSATSDSDSGFPLRLQAKEKQIALELSLEQGKPVVLHGDRGLSVKNDEPGNASYYYSYTRMPSLGSINIEGEVYKVTGNSWMDREWSSSALGKDQVGWDWFALQLSNNQELMFYRFRRLDNTPDQYSYGALIFPDGEVKKLRYDMVELDVTKYWRSESSGVSYPSEWHLSIPAHNLDLFIRAGVADQELALSFRYWEGSVDVRGSQDGKDIVGRGYVELTGYEE